MIEFLTVLSRRWRIVATFVILAVVAAALLTSNSTPTYRAQTQLFVSFANTGSDSSAIDLTQGQLFASNRVKSYPDLVKSPLVLEPVIEELGLDTDAATLADQVSAEVPPNTVLMLVNVQYEAPLLAASIADSVAANLAAVIEDLDKVRPSDPSPVRVSVVRPAVAPTSPSSPIPLLNISVGLLAGLALGLLAALAREALDTTIKDESDVETATGLATLASVPTNPDIGSSPVLVGGVTNPFGSESYRKLRTNISYLDPDNPPRTLLVTSALQGDGKTITAANLAASMAQSGRRTVLVEADLRRPAIAKLLGVVGDVGITTVIAGKATLDDVMQQCSDFSVITSGPIPPNPSELLGSRAFEALIETLLSRFDHVVIDTPPLIAVTDAAVAAAAADAVIIVCRANRTRTTDLRRALYGLRAVDANIAGVVLNQVAMRDSRYYQYDTKASSGRGRKGSRP